MPNIAKLNADAVKNAKVLNREIKKKHKCDHAGDGCKGGVTAVPWYDIYSDVIKGVLYLCENWNQKILKI